MEEKKVGKIINDNLWFLSVDVGTIIQTGELTCVVDYDSRIIKDKKKLEQLTQKYLQDITDFLNYEE